MSYDKASLTEMFNSTDPQQRREAVALLTKFGAKPMEHVKWSIDQKVDFILEHSAAEEKPAAKPGKAAPAKAATTTAKAKAETAPAAGATDGALAAAIAELSEKLDNLQASVEAISAGVDETLAFSRESHFFGLQLASSMGADLSDTSALGSIIFGAEGNDEG
jgi:hypothetical protein